MEQLVTARKRLRKVITIPVNIEIKGRQIVLDLAEAKRYLENAERIVNMDCTCRVQRGNCDAPIHTCLRLNERATQALEIEELEKLNPKEITLKQALKTLEESHRYGLVHMAIAVDQNEVNEICSCCECCCMALSVLVRFGSAQNMVTSGLVSYTDEQKCLTCGVCLERCRFNARERMGDSFVTKLDKCIGCGLCVSTCPTNAIKLVDKFSLQNKT